MIKFVLSFILALSALCEAKSPHPPILPQQFTADITGTVTAAIGASFPIVGNIALDTVLRGVFCM